MSQSVLARAASDDFAIADLALILPSIWSRASSAFPFEWSPDNPSCGQCYPTARLVQTLFGGVIVWQKLAFETGKYDHFVNCIDGVRFDLSAEQMAGESFDILQEKIHTANDIRLLEYLSWINSRVQTLFVTYERYV